MRHAFGGDLMPKRVRPRLVPSIGAVLIFAMGLAGCRSLQKDAAQPGQSWWQRPKVKTQPVQSLAEKKPLAGKIFLSVRDQLLEDYPGLGSTPGDFWIGMDVSRDMQGDNLLQAAVQLVEDMARSFLVSGDRIVIAPWDYEMRSDLRREVVIRDVASASRMVGDILPPSNASVSEGRPGGSLLSIAQKSILEDALQSTQRRTSVVLLLTNLRVDNPNENRWSTVESETVAGLAERFAGRSAFLYQVFDNPTAKGSPHRFYVLYLASSDAVRPSPAGIAVNRRRGGEDQAEAVSPSARGGFVSRANKHRPMSAGWLVLAGLVLAGSVITAVVIISILRVAVTVNGRTDQLRFLNGRGEIVGNQANPRRREWNVALDRAQEGVSLGQVRMTLGTVTIEAPDGVVFAEQEVYDSQVTSTQCVVRPGGHARFQVQGPQGQGYVDIALAHWRQQNPALAAGLMATALVALAAIIAFVVA